RLIDPDPRIHMPAARAWSVYEGACSTLLPNPETIAAFGEDRLALGLARIEAHYFSHHLFPPERDLVDRIDRIRHLPATIVQGRYDMVCPIRSAAELARAWPEAEYVLVREGGLRCAPPALQHLLRFLGPRRRNTVRRFACRAGLAFASASPLICRHLIRPARLGAPRRATATGVGGGPFEFRPVCGRCGDRFG